MNAVSYSAGWMRGLCAGYKLAGHSLLRRFLVHLLLAAVLYGSGIAFLWSAAEIFSRLSSGEPAAVKILGIWEGYWRVRPKHN